MGGENNCEVKIIARFKVSLSYIKKIKKKIIIFIKLERKSKICNILVKNILYNNLINNIKYY